MALDDAQGLPYEIEFEGKTYKVAPIDAFAVQGKYKRYLKQKSLQEVRDVRAELDPLEYQEFMAAVGRDWTCGVYDYGSPTYLKSLQGHDNQVRLLLYQLQEYHPDADVQLAKKLWYASGEALTAANSDATEELGDPKAP